MFHLKLCFPSVRFFRQNVLRSHHPALGHEREEFLRVHVYPREVIPGRRAWVSTHELGSLGRPFGALEKGVFGVVVAPPTLAWGRRSHVVGVKGGGLYTLFLMMAHRPILWMRSGYPRKGKCRGCTCLWRLGGGGLLEWRGSRRLQCRWVANRKSSFCNGGEAS